MMTFTKWVLNFYFLLLVLASLANSEIISINYDVTENNIQEYILGNIAKEEQLLKKHSSEITKAMKFKLIQSKHTDLFNLNENNGILKTISPIDRESICPKKEECVIALDITAKFNDYFEFVKVKINVKDENDNYPHFQESTIEKFFSEASVIGASINLLAASDLDSPKFSIQSYAMDPSLSPPTDTFSLNAILNADGSQRLEIRLIKILDREDISEYNFNIIAFDGGQPSKTGVLSVKILVFDVNDNSPTFDSVTYETQISENIAKFTNILIVHASDPDEGDNGKVIYNFSSETNAIYGDKFGIDADSGEIYNKKILDYEENEHYNLDVMARDKGIDGLSSLTKVKIFIKDLNDHAPQITLHTKTPGMVNVSEWIKAEGFVAHITVIDLDSESNGKFDCHIDHNKTFELISLLTTDYKIVTKELLDRESYSDYMIKFVCADKGSPQQVSTQFISVKVDDENDHAPKFERDAYNFSLLENNKIGAFIMRLTAYDKDIGNNGHLVYSLDSFSMRTFKIDPSTGKLMADVSIDYEEHQFYDIIVTVKDLGYPQLSSTCKIKLKIIDEDDNPPTFDKSIYMFYIDENVEGNFFLGKVVVNDKDGFPYNQSKIFLENETLFRLEQNGNLYTQTKFNREVNSLHTLKITAQSISTQNFSSEAKILITINDVNDHLPKIIYPDFSNHTIHCEFGIKKGDVIARIQTEDEDVGINAEILYRITKGNDNNYFEIDQATGALLINKPFDEDVLVNKTFDLEIVVSNVESDEIGDAKMIRIVVISDLTRPVRMFNRNLIIVVAIACFSGILILILILSIVCIIKKQRNAERKKYNYLVHLAEGSNHTNQSELHMMEIPKSILKPPVVTSNANFNNEHDLLSSIKSNEINHNDYIKYPIKPPYHETLMKNNCLNSFYNNIELKSVRNDDDSDSACSVDMSNTDSGQGSNEDGNSEKPIISTLLNDERFPPPVPAKAPLMTRSLNSGIHCKPIPSIPQNPHYNSSHRIFPKSESVKSFNFPHLSTQNSKINESNKIANTTNNYIDPRDPRSMNRSDSGRSWTLDGCDGGFKKASNV